MSTLEQMHNSAGECRAEILRDFFVMPWRRTTALGKVVVVPFFALMGVGAFAMCLPIMAGLWLYYDSGIEKWLLKEETR